LRFGVGCLFGEWEVAVDVQLEFGLGQLLLDGNAADGADLELSLLQDLGGGGGGLLERQLLVLLLGRDLDDSRGGANWLLLDDLDGRLLELAVERTLANAAAVRQLLWLLDALDDAQLGQLVLQLVEELLDALEVDWLLAEVVDGGWLHDDGLDAILTAEQGGRGRGGGRRGGGLASGGGRWQDGWQRLVRLDSGGRGRHAALDERGARRRRVHTSADELTERELALLLLGEEELLDGRHALLELLLLGAQEADSLELLELLAQVRDLLDAHAQELTDLAVLEVELLEFATEVELRWHVQAGDVLLDELAD